MATDIGHSRLQAASELTPQAQRAAYDEQGYLVFQEKLALLQALQVQIVRRHLRGEAIDRLVEIAMLGLERRDSLLDGFDIEVHVTRYYIKNW